MTNRTVHQYSQIILAVVLCFSLAACLPGKKREERVIAKTQAAMEEVQAEKVAADMLNGAQALLGTDAADMPETNTPNLRTVRCTDDRVMAYVPRTAQIAKGGTIPQTVADRMRNQIKASNSTAQIGDAAMVAACGNPDITIDTVAMNAPVMILTMAAQEDITIAEVADKNKMTVQPCGDGQKGMRIINENGQVDNSLCRDDAGAYFDIETSQTTIPNYKAVLAESGIPGDPEEQVINFTCIAGENGCAKIDKKIEDKIVCKEDNEVRDFMVNPTYDKAERRWKPTNATADCGHGWTGELITRVIHKECTVFRDGVAEALPGRVINIAYVGAKCRKQDVAMEFTCPAGSFFPDGKVMADSFLSMQSPVLLQPIEGERNSSLQSSQLAFHSVDNKTGQVSTNMSEDIASLTQQPLTYQKMGQSGITSASENVFVSDIPLGNIGEMKEFDKGFVDALQRHDKLSIAPTACRVFDQSCSGGESLEMVAVVLDRSGSMNSATQTFIRTETSCRATMADLFMPDQREVACQAAKQYQEILNTKLVNRDNIIAGMWSPGVDNNTQGVQASEELSQLLAGVDAAAASQAEHFQSIMINALKRERDQAYLMNNLKNNQDCYPQYVAENTYGTCSPIYATPDQLNSVDFTEGPLKTCQSTCPGVCITDAIERKNGQGVTFKRTPSQMTPTAEYLPVKMTNPTLMNKVDNFVRSNLIPNIPAGAKVYYSEFFNSEVDDPENADIATKPIDVTFDSDALFENDVKQDPDRLFFWKNMAQKVKEKLDARGNDNGSGMTPLFPAIDVAIDQLLAQKLQANPQAVVNLSIFTDGINNQGPSKYFGNNVCDPQPMPKQNEDGTYQFSCTETAHYNCNGNWKDSAGICSKTANCPSGWTNIRCTSAGSGDNCRVMLCGKNGSNKTFNTADVRTLFGIETPTTRSQYCKTKYGSGSDAMPIFANNPPMGQVDSLVGIIGRNFPNAKIFYLGFPTMYGDDGAIIAKKCGVETDAGLNSYYPGTVSMDDSDQKRVLHAFAYEESVSDSLMKAFGEAVAGRNDDAKQDIGQRICETLWPGIDLSFERLPDNPLDILNPENVMYPSNQCGVSYMQVGAGENEDVPPPYYVPNPTTPPKADSPIYTEPPKCIIAYDDNGNATYINPGTMQVVDQAYCDGAAIE